MKLTNHSQLKHASFDIILVRNWSISTLKDKSYIKINIFASEFWKPSLIGEAYTLDIQFSYSVLPSENEAVDLINGRIEIAYQKTVWDGTILGNCYPFRKFSK